MSRWTRISAAIVMLAVAGLQVASYRYLSESEQVVRDSRKNIAAIEAELEEIDDVDSLEGRAKLFELTRRAEREYASRSVVLHETVERQRKLLLISHLILGMTALVIFGIGVAAEDTGPSHWDYAAGLDSGRRSES
jgi:hypothetical protein